MVLLTGIRVIWRECRDDVRSVRSGGMTRSSLRLSALLLLLLSRWASADLEKGEDDFVRSWVIIEEQLVPPSRDELLAAGGTGGFGGTGAGRRITPKSVFVAPSFNKCSDGYRPDTMGRCVKVVKLNQQAQWDFLLKQLNSMYGNGGGGGGSNFPGAYQPVAMTTTTAEPAMQKTDSPGPFQLNIPLNMGSSNQTTAEPPPPPSSAVGDFSTPTSTVAVVSTTAGTDDATATIMATADANNNPSGTAITDATTTEDGDEDQTATTATGVTMVDATAATDRPRPYHNRYHTHTATEDITATITPPYESTTDAAMDSKTK